MKAQYKVAICMLPLLALGIFGSSVVWPIYLEYQQQTVELTSKKHENDMLLNKLKAKNLAESERNNLETEIGTLRGAVPKSPELDLFLIDLDKMCNNAGVDLIAVEEPDAETVKAIDASEEEMHKISNESSGKLLGSKNLDKSKSTQGKNEPLAEDKTTLKKLIKEVVVSSDYDGLVSLLKKLEHYERITGVKRLSVVVPQEKDSAEANVQSNNQSAEKAKKLGLHQPVMSFVMTLYYLP